MAHGSAGSLCLQQAGREGGGEERWAPPPEMLEGPSPTSRPSLAAGLVSGGGKEPEPWAPSGLSKVTQPQNGELTLGPEPPNPQVPCPFHFGARKREAEKGGGMGRGK